MEVVAHAGSFLLGGVSAVMIMGLLLFFLQPPMKRLKDDQLLKQIAEALLPSPEFQNKPEAAKSEEGAASEVLPTLPSKPGLPMGHGTVAHRLGMGYTPVSELQ
jgi:hypothetical protein